MNVCESIIAGIVNIEDVKFRHIDIELERISKQYDPDGKGLRVLLDPEVVKANSDVRINCVLENVPFYELVRYICYYGKCAADYSYEERTLLLTRQASLPFFSKEFTVSDRTHAFFIKDLPAPKDKVGYFIESGILFPEGSTLEYNVKTKVLTVRNTHRNLYLLSNLLMKDY